MVRRAARRGRRTARIDVAGSDRRLVVGRILLVIALVMTAGRLVWVQGFQANALSEKSERQRITRDNAPAERGSFLDRSGNVLAFNSEAKQLYANPSDLTRTKDEAHAKDPGKPTAEQYKREIARFIHAKVGDRLPEQEVYDVLSMPVKFRYFGPLVDVATARTITEEFPEIGAEHRAVREYPADDVAANIIGAARWSMDDGRVRGLLGLEHSLNTTLAGRDGVKVADTAMGSDLVIPGTERELEPPTPGSDVALTIDSDLQFMVQRELSRYVTESGAKGGSAVVLDAKTGEVYALANDKTFDPASEPATWSPQGVANPAVTTPFEPGSVNKVITAAGAIEHGLVTPQDVLQVPGSIKVADAVIGDAWPHGVLPLTFTGVLGKSSNVGTLMMAQKLGEDRFSELVQKFGVGRKTGVELPGESPGLVPPRNQWSGSTFGNLPIGQGLSMTVLQMAGMYQAIANDGVRVPPRMISAEIRPDGTHVARPAPEPVRVVSPETAHTVRDMLRSVVQDAPQQRGTAPEAALEGYQIAGKTGTAQKIDKSCGCYSQSEYWSTFAGIVPADDPRFVVGLMLDDPARGKSAAPLFHDIASFLTQRYQIPLSKEPAPVQTLQAR
ncbi:penicillin-binding protein 2 [Saccharopolyspora erythraea]|uniref:peptidoglycan D,D-transpeptidase FtsI family protein n=1 Tax=Saccharopolyspora erythraea TaxID=1836 RepID=UPI001BA978F4|nr:penicillin-binding protein 2 [Saccharopolyspora erythraea]QUH00901.1 penicillin-binding protein 2 [Saccharopolyspora erythraea]